ncbi:hypothetical protein BH11PAT4_BH11PAT4_7060 [soil metagenome]
MPMRRLTRLIAILAVLIILLGGVGYFIFSRTTGTNGGSIIKDDGDNVSDYTSVFLANGQVYFGKLYQETGESLDLRDIYYLKGETTTDTKQTQQTGNAPFSLVKLGEELHGPNDRMRINRQQVLFVESLKKDSSVVKAIIEDKGKK